MESAEKTGLDDMEPEGKFDKWFDEHFGEHMMKVIGVVSAVLGVAISLLLFMFLPAFWWICLTSMFQKVFLRYIDFILCLRVS